MIWTQWWRLPRRWASKRRSAFRVLRSAWRVARCAVAGVAIVAWAETAHAEGLGAVPKYIDIPSIGAHAVVVPLGEDPDGTMQAPTDPDTVGWYEPGMGVGIAGNAVLDGHVDWGGRLRVFGRLRQLGPGDTIQITDDGGNVLSYSVSWIQLIEADGAPMDQIFEQPTDEVVTLITCGGAFDPTLHMYVSRWIVRAARTISD